MTKRSMGLFWQGCVVALLLPLSASAHPFHGGATPGLSAGFLHPFSGLDHLLAMLAVGVWAARAGGAWQWRVPALFLAAAGAGCLLPGLLMVSLPVSTEAGIAASLLFLGLLIALEVRTHAAIAAGLVALFGAFHGLAHGIEMPAGASPFLFLTGFLAATALLHGAGLMLGRVADASRWLRAGGAGIAVAGLVLMVLPA